MWCIVGVRVGLPCHDMEVEGFVVKDDAVFLSFSFKKNMQEFKAKSERAVLAISLRE